MIGTSLPTALLLALPLLTFTTTVDASHSVRSRSLHDHLVHIQRSDVTELSLEARLARRLAGSGKQLVNRAAAVSTSQCRQKGAKYIVSSSVTSTTITATTSLASTTSTTSSSTSSTTSTVPSAGSTGSSNSNSASSGSNTPSGTSNVAYGSLTPNGNKAGISGGDAYDYFQGKIGWWYDWTPNPSGHSGKPVAASMLWGAGTADADDAIRLVQFQQMNWNPSYIIGFEEPDCAAGAGSAGMDVATGVHLWNTLVAPHGNAGSVLISPSMCKQAAESGWLGPFRSQISRDWDITNVHINKNSAAGIYADIDHYYNTYGKPIWVTEFACVDDSTGFVPCEDQGQINSYIATAVGIFESDSRIAGYAYSNGYGLGNNWPLMNNGQLSASGQQYLAVLSQYH